MTDLKKQESISYGPSPEIPNNMDYTKLRKTVYEKLKQAQSLLSPVLQFRLYEGYRSLELQKMSGVLSQVGFVNYPTEYRHWSYGDRYWAYNKHQPHAIYASY
jgi:D-alanyl-D-alanine dipeptidase